MTRPWATLAGGATLALVLVAWYYLAINPLDRAPAASSNADTYPVRFPLPLVRAKSPPSESLADAVPPDAATTPGNEVPSAEAPQDVPSPPVGEARVRADGAIIPVEFDLRTMAHRDGSADPDGTVSVKKRMLINGKELGLLELRVDPLGTIAVDTADLVGLLSPIDKSLADAVAGSGQERTTFRALRQRGITINYDPIHDTVLMQDR